MPPADGLQQYGKAGIRISLILEPVEADYVLKLDFDNRDIPKLTLKHHPYEGAVVKPHSQVLTDKLSVLQGYFHDTAIMKAPINPHELVDISLALK
ncbi:hypothetical protein [Hymenobacter cellulosilyticus]|uniref:Uncharacterized protein n=1 Tax=Hymenobacter cellulosilyticus TaxID=2932248 RepID=A0A8T9Q5E7_9BACT|nr:hypothetical protein [Hymenobacter cellulosilyticus]UOQ71000.1 hypothetical protein MUN79_20335 [Hymenobacter cellulosilyticus]